MLTNMFQVLPHQQHYGRQRKRLTLAKGQCLLRSPTLVHLTLVRITCGIGMFLLLPLVTASIARWNADIRASSRNNVSAFFGWSSWLVCAAYV